MSKTEQQKSTAADEGIKQLVSTLPTKPDCNSTTNLLYQYQGFWYHQFYLEHLIAAQTHFTPEPNSTILCSYPKTGTTWLKALSFAITTRTHYPPSQSPLLSRFPHDCVPFFELAPSVARNKLLVATHYTIHNSSFYRKGEVGDWRNFLTEEMGARLDKIMADRFAGSGLGLWFSASNQETTN
ncbi:unnamed protein product [Linum tenue]|uniref:Sulfotransferase n=1 Tax=Linum tenue TaxID=586396 RepID=A0AAV0QIM6_9ROSI|nr:unnamed protein product [Linum tenue]